MKTIRFSLLVISSNVWGCDATPMSENNMYIPDINCTDTAGWTMPVDSMWKNSKFQGMTCPELESLIAANTTSSRKSMCDFFSAQVTSVETANNACCFCGGGNIDGVSSSEPRSEPTCYNMEFNSVGGEASGFNCQFIEENGDTQTLCETFGDESFSADGLTIKDACCACGGGDKHNGIFSAGLNVLRNRDRNLLEDPVADSYKYNVGLDDSPETPNLEYFGLDKNTTTDNPLGSAESIDKSKLNINVDYQPNGLVDVPGIPNIEYLGLGYDIITGNPRGSEHTNLDDGFRNRVVKLIVDQDNLKADEEFIIPYGTQVNYVSSCEFDSTSKETSSESDLRQSMSKEATIDQSISASVQASHNNLLGSVSSSISSSYSFSQSSQFSSNSETSKSEKTVSFESKAICSEFEATFIPSYQHTLDPEFVKELGKLPVPYDKNNPYDRAVFDTFFKRYGTNYVSYVVLGGKRILTTSMSQFDYSSLVSESVDIESTMSFEMAAAMSASVSVKAGLVSGLKSAASSVVSKLAGAASVDNTVNVVLEDEEGDEEGDEEDDKVLFGASVESDSKYSLSQFASSKSQAEQVEKIAEKKTKTTEFTLGGLPAEDWREWAATVRAKPMPIRYKVKSLMDFMTFTQQNAFVDAFQDIYGIDLSAYSDEPFLKGAVHHGVYTGRGDPLSSHTLDPNVDTRVLMQVDAITYLSSTETAESSDGISTIAVFDEGTGDFNDVTRPETDVGACGLKIVYQPDYTNGDKCRANDKVAVYDIQFKYCNVKDWQTQTTFESVVNVPVNFVDDVVLKGNEQDCVPTNKEYDCDEDEFLCGFDIAYCGQTSNNNQCEDWPVLGTQYDNDMGMYGVKAYCKKIGEACEKRIMTHCEDKGGKGCDAGDSSYRYPVRLGTGGIVPSSIGTDFVIVGASTKFGQLDDKDAVGVSALNLNALPVSVSYSGGYGPPSAVYTYTGIWKGKGSSPTAIFATPIRRSIAPNTAEHLEFPFRTSYFGTIYNNWRDNVYFTLTNNINLNGNLAVTNMGDLDLESLGTSRLPGFSFLSVDSLIEFGDEFISGVVAHKLLIVSESTKDDFQVTKIADDTFKVIFADKNYDEVPTVVAFPNWFSEGGDFYPQQIQDLVFTLSGMTDTYFTLKHGPYLGDVSYFGFNFLVIGADMDTTHVKHGIVSECTEDNASGLAISTFHGISLSSTLDCPAADSKFVIDGVEHTGVEVFFDESFSDIPSVIVAPYTDYPNTIVGCPEYIVTPSIDAYIPRCLVESITKTSAVVKCGMILECVYGSAGLPAFFPIPFSFVAVGY